MAVGAIWLCKGMAIYEEYYASPEFVDVGGSEKLRYEKLPLEAEEWDLEDIRYMNGADKSEESNQGITPVWTHRISI